MPLSSPHFDYADTVYDAASETNKSSLQSYRDCKHEQLDWFLAQALEIVETQCSKSLDGYHLKMEDLCINVLWFLNVEMA